MPISSIAPAFKLMNQDEEWVSLSELAARGPVMIAFYPDDFSPVCTRQLCSYQEAFDRFVQYGIQVVAISPNPPERHNEFRARYQFAFPLLSDPDKATFKAYGVTSLFLFGGTSRAVFILGKDGGSGAPVLYRYVEATTLTHRKPGELVEILDKLRSARKI